MKKLKYDWPCRRRITYLVEAGIDDFIADCLKVVGHLQSTQDKVADFLNNLQLKEEYREKWSLLLKKKGRNLHLIIIMALTLKLSLMWNQMTNIITILAKTFHTLTYNGYGISDSCLISHDIPDKANWYLVFKTLTLMVMIFLLISHYMFKTYLICLSNRHSVICISPKPNPNWQDSSHSSQWLLASKILTSLVMTSQTPSQASTRNSSCSSIRS